MEAAAAAVEDSVSAGKAKAEEVSGWEAAGGSGVVASEMAEAGREASGSAEAADLGLEEAEMAEEEKAASGSAEAAD